MWSQQRFQPEKPGRGRAIRQGGSGELAEARCVGTGEGSCQSLIARGNGGYLHQEMEWGGEVRCVVP